MNDRDTLRVTLNIWVFQHSTRLNGEIERFLLNNLDAIVSAVFDPDRGQYNVVKDWMVESREVNGFLSRMVYLLLQMSSLKKVNLEGIIDRLFEHAFKEGVKYGVFTA